MESDLSAFHRVDDMYAMESARFLRLADRLPAYGGVLSAVVKGEPSAISEITKGEAGEVPGAPVPGTRDVLARAPALAAAPGIPAVCSVTTV